MKKSNTNVRVETADNLEDIKESMKLSIKLALEIEDKAHHTYLMQESAEYFYNNPELSSVVVLKDNETNQIVGKNVINLQFSVERNEIINGPNSLYIEADYRNIKNSSKLKNYMGQLNIKLGLKYFYGYFMSDNLIAKAIYIHWGMTLREELDVYCADFVLRKDKQTQKNLEIKENVNFFKEKFTQEYEKGNDKRIVFKTFDKFDYEEIKGITHQFQNILNKNWITLNEKGLKTLAFNKEIRKRNMAFTIKYDNEIVGIITTHRGFNEWRGGNWCWLIAFYMNKTKISLSDKFIRNMMLEVQKYVVSRGISYNSDRKNYFGNFS